MGVLVDVTCDALLLPRPKFEQARKALARLAEKSPDAFEDAGAVTEALDLEEALASARFRYEKDENGDITRLRYGVDKAPSVDESWPEAICRALATAVTKGTITVGYEEEPHETRYVFGRGKLQIERRKKSAKKKLGKKATKSPDAVAFPGEPTTFTVLPEESLGVVWNIHAEIEERGWYRDRARIGALVDRLLATAYLAEVGTVAALDRAPAIDGSPKRRPLDPIAVKKLVANGQRERWSFTREDGEVSVDLGIYELGTEITFRARDAGLARLGDAAHADPRAFIGHLAALVGDDGWLHGFAAPFAASMIDEAARTRVDLPVRWHPAAFAVILDARIPDHEDHHDEVKALLAAKAPKGCEVANHGKVRTLTWPWLTGKRAELRAALRAYDAWLGRHVERFAPRTPKGAPPAPPAPAERPAAPPGDIANYELWWRIEWEVFDRSSWYREPARIAHVVEAIAKTAWWSEVASPGCASIEEAIARASTGARGETHVKGTDAKVTINRFGVSGLHLRFVGKSPALARMASRATSDVVTLVSDLAKTFRGRAELTYACARPYGGPWAHRYSDEDESTDFEWPEAACTVLVLHPGAQGSDDPQKLARVRALAAATPPDGARREERDGLVVLTFLDGAADPIAAADASQAHARWQRWVRGEAPLAAKSRAKR